MNKPTRYSFLLIGLCSGFLPASTAGQSNLLLTIPAIIAASNRNTVISAGQRWMDRNLGASQVATSATDAAAYGDLYQWGRLADGHESRTSTHTATNSSSDVPGNGYFIMEASAPYDWRTPQNNDLWQGVSATNNPCPAGFRLPTSTEWDTERASWSSNNSAGAFASPLKLVTAGFRNRYDASLNYADRNGDYWSSTVNGSDSHGLGVGSDDVEIYSYHRAYGLSVRCIKD